MAAAKQQQWAERIFDAAAELVLRWGYKRVGIEEVARHAGDRQGHCVPALLYAGGAVHVCVDARVIRTGRRAGRQEAAGQPLRKLKIDLADELFELLRDRGLMRTDLDAETQRYVLNTEVRA